MKVLKNMFKNLKNNFTKKIKRIKKDHLIKLYFKNNIIFVSFVILMVINSTLLRFLCMHSLENYLSIKAILADVIVCTFIGAFGYLINSSLSTFTTS